MPATGDSVPTIDNVLESWKLAGVRNVRFELPDMHGTSRSKIVRMGHTGRYAQHGLNMYGGTVVLDSRSDVVPGTLFNEEVAYGDQLLRPDPATAAIVPWVEATGRMICDTTWPDGRPLEAAPRYVFQRVLDRCHRLGYEVLSGIEPEFYLVDATSKAPLFEGHHIFNTPRNTYVPLIERIIAEMGQFGIDLITANCEYAGSQWEINFAPARGIVGPDIAFSFKNGVKEMAQHGGLSLLSCPNRLPTRRVREHTITLALSTFPAAVTLLRIPTTSGGCRALGVVSSPANSVRRGLFMRCWPQLSTASSVDAPTRSAPRTFRGELKIEVRSYA